MSDDNQNLQDNNQTDDVAQQLAGLSGGSDDGGSTHFPGQQFTPASQASDDTTTSQPDQEAEEETFKPYMPPRDEPVVAPIDSTTSTDQPADDSSGLSTAPDPYHLSTENDASTPVETAETTSPQTDEATTTDANSNPAPEPVSDLNLSDLVDPSPASLADDSGSTTTTTDDTSAMTVDDSLEEIKKQAVSELSPLIDKLDLPPEKRYDILMEIIQANNDSSKLKDALKSASEITDESLRAQALMEILDEVKYFTNSSEKTETS